MISSEYDSEILGTVIEELQVIADKVILRLIVFIEDRN
jgi:hypothetical protein